jgi:hypothetical protein
MAPSKWMRSIRAVRETPVVDYSTPGLNATRRIVSLLLSAVSLILCGLSVSYFKWSPWCFGQLWPDVRIGSFVTRLHWDCNATGDTAKMSRHVPSTCTLNATLCVFIIHSIPCHQIYVARDHPSLIQSISCLTTIKYISGIMCTQPTMFPILTTYKATAPSDFLTCADFETGSKLPEFSGIVVNARANQYSTKAPSLFRSLILNSHCSCHRWRPFSAPQHLPGHCFAHNQSFYRSLPRHLWLPAHWHIWNMRSPSKP